MPIKRSTAAEVSGLLQDLQAGDEVARQAAAARLSVIGTRAVEGLVGLVGSGAPTAARIAALAALEAIGDPRGVEPALAALTGSEPALAAPAASVLRGALDSSRGALVLDSLTAIVLDVTQPQYTRLAALSALQALPARTISPIWEKLAHDPDPAIRSAVGPTSPDAEMAPPAALEAAASGALPEDPAILRRWVVAGGSAVSLPVLHRLVEASRKREVATTDAATRAGWMTARAAAHLALAERGSRVALYDLRETIERGETAPVEMLRALEAIGDRSCLDAIASAFARLSAGVPSGSSASAPPSRSSGATPGSKGAATASATESAWWRQHLATTFRAIATREKLTERHAVVKQIRARWPQAAIDLLGRPK